MISKIVVMLSYNLKKYFHVITENMKSHQTKLCRMNTFEEVSF